LSQIVKIVFMIDPSVSFVSHFQTLGFVFDHVRVWTLTIEENSFK
jgi:hypothetical protein